MSSEKSKIVDLLHTLKPENIALAQQLAEALEIGIHQEIIDLLELGWWLTRLDLFYDDDHCWIYHEEVCIEFWERYCKNTNRSTKIEWLDIYERFNIHKYLYIGKLTKLPKLLGLCSSFRHLSIYNRSFLESIALSFIKERGGAIKSIYLKELNLSHTEYQVVFNSPNVADLEVIQTNVQKSTLNGISNMKSLEKLVLEHNDELEFLPNSLRNLTKLKSIKILNNGKLKVLPDSLGSLMALKELTLEGNDELEFLPNFLGNLTELKSIKIINNKKLKSLPDSLGNLVALEKLIITGNKQLRLLPESIGRLENLEELIIKKNSLEEIPSSISQLRKLRKVSFANNNLNTIPESVLKLPCLNNRVLLAFNRFSQIPKAIQKAPNIRKIDMRGNPISKATIEEYVKNSATVEIVYYNYQEELPNGIIQNRRGIVAKNDLAA